MNGTPIATKLNRNGSAERWNAGICTGLKGDDEPWLAGIYTRISRDDEQERLGSSAKRRTAPGLGGDGQAVEPIEGDRGVHVADGEVELVEDRSKWRYMLAGYTVTAKKVQPVQY